MGIMEVAKFVYKGGLIMGTVDRRKIFGKRLKQVLIERGMSQTKLALELSTSDKTISSYVYGNANPPLAVVVAIAEKLNITSDFLLGLSNELKELNDTNNPIDDEILIIRQSYSSLSEVQREAVLALIQSITEEK